jgi:hypothetical protein
LFGKAAFVSRSCHRGLSLVNAKFPCRSRSGGLHLAPKIDMVQFDMPNLIAGFIFGSIGFVAFTYGKRMSLWKPMFCGIGLMVYPYFVENMFLLFGIGGIGTAALFFLRD